MRHNYITLWATDIHFNKENVIIRLVFINWMSQTPSSVWIMLVGHITWINTFSTTFHLNSNNNLLNNTKQHTMQRETQDR